MIVLRIPDFALPSLPYFALPVIVLHVPGFALTVLGLHLTDIALLVIVLQFLILPSL